MEIERIPSRAHTYKTALPTPQTTPAPRDRFIVRTSPPFPPSSSPRPLISQEAEPHLSIVPQPPPCLSLLKVIEAPGVDNDYHLNLMAWSDGDVLVVALKCNLCLYNGHSGAVSEVKGRQKICSVAPQPGGGRVAVGTDRACIRLVDVATGKTVSEVTVHKGRIVTMAWNGNALLSGSKDNTIHLTDLRSNVHGGVLRGHSSEVCTLALNHLNSSELASGGADNRILLWDLRNRRVRTEGQHRACVKALTWFPWKADRLMSGAGYADGSVKEWSTNGELACVQGVDTGAQVSSFLWDRWERRLLVGQGYPLCALSVWEGTRKLEDYIHCGRVLALASAPLGDRVASLSSDETVRLWGLGPFSSSDEESLSSHSRRYAFAR